MTTRRDFLALTAGAAALWPSVAIARDLAGRAALGQGASGDEPFWARLRAAYDLDPDVVNLDHGWTNPAPRAALDELNRRARELEALPAVKIMTFWEEVTNISVRASVAAIMGVPPTEIAFVRNATEALNTVILGLPMKAGDEILCSAHDYYAMLDAIDQRRRRDGVVVRMVRPAVPAVSLDAIAAMYEAEMRPRTRLVLLTHPSNLTGQLLPVRRIAAAAHRVGAEVVVDGAQSLGLLPDPVRSLDCDYYGASLHKWLGAPIGMGVLWMRPEHVDKVWPIVPPPAGTKGMTRFEWIGTNPEFIGPSLGPALAVHDSIGAERKAARLRHLNRYWRTRVATALPRARFSTADDEAMSCGICIVSLPGADHAALQQRLLKQDRILVQAMTSPHAPEISGLRVTPNVYTPPQDLDRFVDALIRATR